MKAKVDSGACTACEQCCEEVPAVFEMSDEGVAVVKGDTVPADQEGAVRDVADSCPVSAIEVID